MKENPEIVICAAIRMHDDGYVVRGHRHADAIRTAREIPRYQNIKPQSFDQGFVTSKNRYVGRAEGCAIQKAAGIESVCEHPNDRYLGNELYSEDLY